MPVQSKLETSLEQEAQIMQGSSFLLEARTEGAKIARGSWQSSLSGIEGSHSKSSLRC